MTGIDVQIEDGGPCRKVMHIKAPAEAVTPEYDKVIEEFAAIVKVPGFRSGKAPKGVVAKRFEDRIVEETRDRLVPKVYRDAVSQSDVDPVAVVNVSEVVLRRDEGLSFDATVDVTPEFKLPRYKRISLKRQPVEVTDEEVEDAVKRIIESRSQFEDIDGRPVQNGDLVKIDYRGTCDGVPVQSLDPSCEGIGENKDFWMMCQEPSVLPGFAEGLAGAAIGDERRLEASFPDDFRVEAVRGKSAVYDVTVTGIRERRAPEMNEEFFKQFEVDSESAFREKVREQLAEGKEREEQGRLKSEIAQYLLQKTEFDLPQTVVEQEMQIAVRSIVDRFIRQGGTREQIESQKDTIFNNASESSKERVKLSYILVKIAEAEGIEVVEDEVSSRIAEMAGQYGMSAERFRSEMERRNAIDGLRSDMRSEKTLDFLLEHAKIKGKA